MLNGERHIYAGLSGVEINADRYELGDGIEISSTYAKVFSPIMIAFSKGPPGKHTPGPWYAVEGGWSYEIVGQLAIPPIIKTQTSFDQINTAWWILALLRLICGHGPEIPVCSDTPFADVKDQAEKPTFIPMEFAYRKSRILQHGIKIESDHLEWVKQHWKAAATLYHEKKSFGLAIQLIDQMIPVSDRRLYFLGLWTALEGLFTEQGAEASYRVSTNIATFLSRPGEERYERYRKANSLYRARSKVVHGKGDLDDDTLVSTYLLLREVLARIIELDQVPTEKELQKSLFGQIPWVDTNVDGQIWAAGDSED